ncbi:hypothetical protein SAMN06296010_0900 [Agreia pratensis]|uniref:TfoX N-terminal domain-containing protein n=2 Tax=Agreia pratensis TaxID=150121 RepID=A0A1X7IVK7_9MICO|nr:hypothetical protein SAMN06296010_0900 [Agreia pratensis]
MIPMSKPSDEAVELLHEIAADLGKAGPVELGTMFRSPGIRTETKIVAFLGTDDRLIVKLPRERALALIEQGVAASLSMGRRTMREWIEVPAGDDLHTDNPSQTLETWSRLAKESFDHVRSQL